MNKCFLPSKACDLVRIGNKYDGGYVIPKDCLRNTDILFGFGLSEDWSFEKEFKKLSSCEVICYDHSIDRIFWMKLFLKFLRDLFIPQRWYILKGRFFAFFSFYNFFNNKNATHKKIMVGPTWAGGFPLKEITKSCKEKAIFFKIDIEGGEYRILEELIQLPLNITGCAIEFHDTDLHQEVIKSFIDPFELDLVHIHGNNWGPANEQLDPITLELTFASKKYVELRPAAFLEYPRRGLDSPNLPYRNDYSLNFE